MNIALVQHAVSSPASTAVEQGARAVRAAADAGADLVVFPELSFTPFYPRVPVTDRDQSALDLAEPVPGPTTEALATAAADGGVVVVFNLMERAGDRTFDTSPVLDADGTLLGRTRMMHITAYDRFHEQGYYAPGDTGAPVYDTAAGRIGVAICYDRHYPEYLRALALQDADLVVVPQAGTVGEWPDGMYEAELRTAALQHGFFTALANRTGTEGNMQFAGRSFVTGPLGSVLAQAPGTDETTLHASVDLARTAEAPARQLFLRHRRPDQYEQGAVAVASDRTD
ncbi:carbon-nitrogen hydrolase family protein [Salinibacter altiplanensis]|uniref:carbon-nitrogen hydrolase family protein n=1 Tax=Salinibacter altiplanensis TaxID=1803181 RepID=UPI000C9F4130|nr:carbon-nitrogen hydrolase family protein [Salinibacter altiplanensis]